MIKFSIIVVVKNRVSTINSAITSILQQNYKNFEIIVIDGKSTDGTLDKLKKFKKNLKVLISENDSGVYYAMNKGLKYASGDVICFLNSDDYFANSNVLSSINLSFEKNNCEIVYGDIIYITNENPYKIVRYWKSNFITKKSFLFGHHPPHPAFYAKKELYDKFGNFNTLHPIIADYELMMRFFNNCKNIAYLEKICVVMRLGGLSNKNIVSIYEQNKNLIRLLKEYDNNFKAYMFVITKIIIKVSQYIFAKYYNKRITNILN